MTGVQTCALPISKRFVDNKWLFLQEMSKHLCWGAICIHAFSTPWKNRQNNVYFDRWRYLQWKEKNWRIYLKRFFDKIDWSCYFRHFDSGVDICCFRHLDKSKEMQRFDIEGIQIQKVITFGRRRVEASGERRTCRRPSVIVLGLFPLVTVMLFVYK